MPLTRQAMEIAQRFGFHYCSGFNMTELSVPLVTDIDTPRAGQLRAAAHGCECRIVDENDIECPPGVPGELIVRNDLPWTTSLGYINQPEANARAWRNGWFHTGDLLHATRRATSSSSTASRTRSGAAARTFRRCEVEAEVFAFPASTKWPRSACRAEIGEEEVLVAVAPTPGAAVDPAALMQFLIPRMPHYMVPRYVRVMESLPKTPTNKVRKVEIRQQGVTADCWDRVASGIEVRRAKL